MDDRNTDQTQQQTQNQQSQGGGVGNIVNKEQEPSASSRADSSFSEFVKPSGHEIEPQLHPELEKIGVTRVSDFPKVGPTEQKVGISPTGASVPVLTQTSKLIKLHEELRAEGADRQGTESSGHWLLALLEKVLKHFR